MDLTKLRDDFLIAVAEYPIHEWPGPPPGLENVPSCSYIGPFACKRKAYYRIMSHQGILRGYTPPEATPLTGGNELAAQRGWLLENSVCHWLSCNGADHVTTYKEALVYPQDDPLFYGHPDGACQIDGETYLLEIKHQNAMRFGDFLKSGLENMQSPYYAQVQGYLLASGLNHCLFTALSSDPSSVKGQITWAKRRRDYAGEMEPDFRAVPNCSGVNPFLYLEVIEANKPFQRAWVLAWCKEIKDAVENALVPEPTFDTGHDWQCRAEWCEFRSICDRDGTTQRAPVVEQPQVERGVTRE